MSKTPEMIVEGLRADVQRYSELLGRQIWPKEVEMALRMVLTEKQRQIELYGAGWEHCIGCGVLTEVTCPNQNTPNGPYCIECIMGR